MRWLALALLASCAAPEPQRCTIRPVTILTTDAITPVTRAALRHLNAEIESQCGRVIGSGFLPAPSRSD